VIINNVSYCSDSKLHPVFLFILQRTKENMFLPAKVAVFFSTKMITKKENTLTVTTCIYIYFYFFTASIYYPSLIAVSCCIEPLQSASCRHTSARDPGSIPGLGHCLCGVYMFSPVSAWVSSGCSGFLPQSDWRNTKIF